MPGTIKLGQRRVVVSRVAIEKLLQGDGKMTDMGKQDLGNVREV